MFPAKVSVASKCAVRVSFSALTFGEPRGFGVGMTAVLETVGGVRGVLKGLVGQFKAVEGSFAGLGMVALLARKEFLLAMLFHFVPGRTPH